MNIFLAADRLIIAKRSQIVYLHFSDILFIERFRQKTLVHAHHHEYSIKHSLKEINNLLPDMVVRAHRSFIVCADRCRYDGFLYFRFILFRSNTIAIVFSVFVLFGGNIFSSVLSRTDSKLSHYLLFTHLNLDRYITGNTALEGVTIVHSIVVVSLYLLLFISLGWFVFQRREMN